jgi:CCR4-NOT transcription complex subunit 1
LDSLLQIAKKDFAMDPDEGRLRAGAHCMVRNLTAGMAMITCRDHLHLSIKTNLKNFMVTLGRNLTLQQQEAIDTTVERVASDNVELACAFIQRKAIDKAIVEIDTRLKPEYEARAMARKEGRRHCDQDAASYQTNRMPETIRVKPGAPTPQQRAVYEEFGRNIPGFKPLTEREAAAIAPKPTQAELAAAATAASGSVTVGSSSGPTTSEECVAILEEVFLKVDPFVQNCTTLPTSPHMNNLRALLEAMSRAKSSREPSAVALLVDKAVENLLQGLTAQAQVDTESLARYRDANLLVLRAINDPRGYGPSWTSSRITRALMATPEELNKYNLDAFDVLVRSGMVNLSEYDKHLSKAVTAAVDAAGAGGQVPLSVQFAMHLCKIYLLDERANAHVMEADLARTVEVLTRLAAAGQGAPVPDNLSALVEMIQQGNLSGPTGQLHSGIQQAREFEDPPGKEILFLQHMR